jgi:hypothetical protein
MSEVFKMDSCIAEVYIIEIRRKNEKSFLNFGRFDGVSDFDDAIRGLGKKLKPFQEMDLLKRAISVDLDPGNSTRVSGYLWVGSIGTETDIVDVKSGAVAHRKKRYEADTYPHYFQMSLPKKGSRGILCLQQVGVHGVKSLFERAVFSRFQEFYPDYRIQMKSITLPGELANLIQKGIIQEIIVEKHEIPSDIADKVGGAQQKYEGKMSLSIRPSSKDLFNGNALLALSRGEGDLLQNFDVFGTGFDVVRSTIEFDGRKRKVNLSKGASLATSFDLTDDLDFDTNGIPLKKSIAKEFEAIILEVSKRGGIRI